MKKLSDYDNWDKGFAVVVAILIVLFSYLLYGGLVVNTVHEGVLLSTSCANYQSGALFNDTGSIVFVKVNDLGMCMTLALHQGHPIRYWTDLWNTMKMWVVP